MFFCEKLFVSYVSFPYFITHTHYFQGWSGLLSNGSAQCLFASLSTLSTQRKHHALLASLISTCFCQFIHLPAWYHNTKTLAKVSSTIISIWTGYMILLSLCSCSVRVNVYLKLSCIQIYNLILSLFLGK